MSKPPEMLEGYRVLEFTHFVAGPTCGRILAELGAEVVKVERPPGGDHARQFGVRAGTMSTYYFQHNRHKRSLAVDLRQARAKEIVRAMVAKADVVVENYAPGVIQELGFSYEAIKKINPSVVMCSISMAGQQGPLSHKPGYDWIGQAYAGITGLIGEPDAAPSVVPLAMGDVSTGVVAAMAVGFALLNRERTGRGQYIDASLIDTYFHMHELSVPVVSMRPERYVPSRVGSTHPSLSPCGVFKAGDGYIFLVVNEHEIERLARAMGRPELFEEERFKTNRDRVRNRFALKQIIEQWLASFSERDSALAVLERERVPCAPVLSLADAMAHPHLRERATVQRVKHEALGEFDIPGSPVRFSTWRERPAEASRLGQDNDAVLRDWLSLPDSEIAELYAGGILYRPE